MGVQPKNVSKHSCVLLVNKKFIKHENYTQMSNLFCLLFFRHWREIIGRNLKFVEILTGNNFVIVKQNVVYFLPKE